MDAAAFSRLGQLMYGHGYCESVYRATTSMSLLGRLLRASYEYRALFHIKEALYNSSQGSRTSFSIGPVSALVYQHQTFHLLVLLHMAAFVSCYSGLGHQRSSLSLFCRGSLVERESLRWCLPKRGAVRRLRVDPTACASTNPEHMNAQIFEQNGRGESAKLGSEAGRRR